ncbi:MAG: heparinase II/III domain-containing protein [Gemmatirosa sp.]
MLLGPRSLASRRAAVAGPLAPLATSLAADLERVLAAAPEPDRRKARLTRAGGRCPRDGAPLAFDPFAPTRHRCPRCDAVWQDEAHDRWWIMWHQLWLAERAVHASVLHLLVGAPRLAAFAAGVLDAYATRYLDYPNRDNVLGPSRPFFSTYLESIWLLQLCVALDALEMVEGDRVHSLGARVRDRVVAPSRALIAGYPEPGSNRQVWNAAALLAAARVLGDHDGTCRALDGPTGVTAQLRDGLLTDGSWYEGENYHQFAHRGLWYGVALAESAGMSLPEPLLTRFADGFAAPFLVAMPDYTLPSRRDSQYAISLRQWRYAESCELGLERGDDARLSAALGHLYGDAVPRRDSGRWRSAAESERNEPATALSRADLGWRALLHARPEPPNIDSWAPGTVHLPAQGLAVFRRDAGRLWVALDYGHSGGGHGHPDRLNLLVSDGATRWLDDMGTGTYVERALHWYRSTLAHQAPLVDGASQPRSDGALLGMDEQESLSGISAASRIGHDVVAARTVVVDREYLVDRLVWSAARDVVLDLPFHVDGEAALVQQAGDVALMWIPTERVGAGGLEDGFDFVDGAERVVVPAGGTVRVALRAPDRPARDAAALWLLAEGDVELWRARAPGPPGASTRRFHVVRASRSAGALLSVLDPRGVVSRVTRQGSGAIAVTLIDGTEVEHRWPAVGDALGRWVVRRLPQGARIALALPAILPAILPAHIGQDEPTADPVRAPRSPIVLDEGEAWEATLRGAHYRRSEESWEEAGRPTAQVRLSADADSLQVAVDVTLGRAPAFVPPGAQNLLDNERAEINGDGVQLYLASETASPPGEVAGWLLVPGSDGAVRVIPTTPAAHAIRLEAASHPVLGGYGLTAIVRRAALDGRADGEAARTVLVDVLVNEMPSGRERRRGQLVLSGAEGGFVYLQGDRHAAARCVPVVLPPPIAR